MRILSPTLNWDSEAKPEVTGLIHELVKKAESTGLGD